jgi:ribosomal protein S18 acetylase RimI-like enzyme
MINAVLDIKLLAPEEWHVLRTTRLRALRDSPHAFASSLEAEVGWGEAQWRRLITAATWVVAIEAGAVIGIASVVDRYDGRHVESIWVAPAHRQRGVFRALLRALVDRERANGAHDLVLWVVEDNDDALRTYRRLGFVPTGERQRLSGDRHELRLRLRIGTWTNRRRVV